VNTLSKVFVVVNLVFAAFFCAFTLTLYSKRVDWKDACKQWEMKYDNFEKEKEAEIAQVTKEREALKDTLAITVSRNKTLYEKNAEYQQDLKNQSVARYEAEQERRLLTDRIEAATLELDRRYKHIERMHRIVLTQQKALEISKSNMRNALNERMEMENEANNARHRLVASQKEMQRLEKDLHHNSWVIQKLQGSGVPVQDIVFGAGEQPDIEIHGKVLAVRPEVNLVMVSVGTDQKVRKGYRFTVFREDRYIGKVEVEKVFDNMCSARILSDWTKEKVKEGDDVSTMTGG
jgi:hypothetical protein